MALSEAEIRQRQTDAAAAAAQARADAPARAARLAAAAATRKAKAEVARFDGGTHHMFIGSTYGMPPATSTDRQKLCIDGCGWAS